MLTGNEGTNANPMPQNHVSPMPSSPKGACRNVASLMSSDESQIKAHDLKHCIGLAEPVEQGAEGFLIQHTISESASSQAPSSSASAVSVESYLKNRLKKHFRTGIPFYKRPIARYRWGQKQGHAHHVWGSLFFDLAYVGIAFKLGDVVADGIKNRTIVASIGLVISIFYLLEMCWHTKLGLDARFKIDDLFHRFHQITLGAIVAISGNAIASLPIMEDKSKPQTLTLSCAVLAFHIIDSIPLMELFNSPISNVRGMSRTSMVAKLFPISLSAGSVVSAIYGPLWSTCLLWFSCGNWLKLYVLFLSLTNVVDKTNSIPMHVNWSLHRHHEFLLLMIGESIISIIVVPYRNTTNYIVTYFLSFCLVATLALVVFAANVGDDNRHAMRRSSFRASLYFQLLSIQSLNFILVGVGFKLILETTEQLTDITTVWFMNIVLGLCLVSLLLGRVLHHGLSEEYFLLQKRSQKIKKILFWLVRLLLIGILFATIPMNAPPYGLMIWYWGITACIYLVQLLDLRAFEDHHLALVDKEVQERTKRYKDAGFEVTEHPDNEHPDGAHHHHGGLVHY